jgi:lipopolysaccharide export system permease protein
MIVFRRYLAREVYKATAVAAVAFLGLFAFFDLINELEDIGKAGYRIQHAIGFVLLTLPGHLYELFPIVVLVGTLVALASLAATSEYTVMRTAGLSPLAAAAMLARIGAVFVVIAVLIGEAAAPWAERTGQRLRLDRLGLAVAGELRSGIWVKSDQRFVNVNFVLPDTSLQGVQIYEFGPDFRLLSISQAATGRYAAEAEAWRLADVVRTTFGADSAKVERLPELEWRSVLTPAMLSALTAVPDKMSAWSLVGYIRHLDENRQATRRYEIALWKKLVYPFAALVMMALALPFAYLQVRSGGVGVKVFAGIMLGILFHFLNSLFSTLGVLQSWPPLAAALLPSAVFLAMAIGLMWWVERR